MWAEAGGLKPLVSWYKELVPSSQTHLRTSALDGGHQFPFCSPPAMPGRRVTSQGLDRSPEDRPSSLRLGRGQGELRKGWGRSDQQWADLSQIFPESQTETWSFLGGIAEPSS